MATFGSSPCSSCLGSECSRNGVLKYLLKGIDKIVAT